MLSPVVSSLIFIDNRRLAEIFPTSLRDLWNDWELRVAVVVSLSMQIFLIALGSRRKYVARDWLTVLIWTVYLSADGIVNLSFGVLSNMESTDEKGLVDPQYMIMAFWAPLLLLHLGGLDTITAYSLEDNELWMRQLLGLVVKFVGAFYVFIKSWTGSLINLIVIPMFVIAIMKCGERTWALRFASSDQFRKSMLPRPDPEHSYAKFMDDYTSKKAEGYNVSLEPVIEEASVVLDHTYKAVGNTVHLDIVILHDAAYLFSTFKRLFADLILSFQDLESSRSFFQDAQTSWENAFKVIEIELGFMYDFLYTKATVTHTYVGSFLRIISLSSTILVASFFAIIDKNSFSRTDKSITFVLLVSAIALQAYEIVLLLSSDRIVLWLSRHKNLLLGHTNQTISCIQSWLQSCHVMPAGNKRWSNCMAKYNLISNCLKDKPIKFSGFLKFLCIYEMVEKNQYKVVGTVSPELKRMIFEQLLPKSRNPLDITISKQRGSHVLKDMGCFDKIEWSVESEFDQSILLWHIATDLCYEIDLRKSSNIIGNPICDESKSLA
ncbi:uncharacterized protein LOC126656745 [Mercurialis annua]|uniref:uncharacterized protein LOC126656745 n=1 Tax=Mercurialis annua TaxID=3986 RepID=UPI0024AFDE7A|nr:uncharacterized protein LOC126656745 [Mercurialis annua]